MRRKHIKKRTHEEYVSELEEKNPNVKVIGNYIDATTKIKHLCLIHNMEWETTPTRALLGKGCPKCHAERISKKKTRTNEWYIDTVHDISTLIIPLEPYIDCRTPIRHYCTKHNHIWLASPNNILDGHGCKYCGIDRIKEKKTNDYEQYVKQLHDINPNIVCIGKYKNKTTQVLHRCLIDGYVWETVPSYLLSGRGCPKCSNKLTITDEIFKDKVQEINPDIEVIDKYINARTQMFFRCKTCGNEWKTTPEIIMVGCGCPICKESHGEREIRNWLNSNHIQFESQKKFDGCRRERKLPFDFYLPDYNLIIEYDGKQHYQPVNYFGGETAFELLKERDRIKTDFCKENNIGLLRIPYDKDIETELNNYFST